MRSNELDPDFSSLLTPHSSLLTEFRGLGSNQLHPRSKRGVLPLNYPGGISAEYGVTSKTLQLTRHSSLLTFRPESVLRESNPPSRFGRPEPLPLGQRHVLEG